MYLIPFYMVEPGLAFRETRVMHLMEGQEGLPRGSYGLLESYCPDPDCDCRRVMLHVVEEKRPEEVLASISFGFDPESEMAGPFLDPVNPQSAFSEPLLELVERLVLSNSDYVARLEWHYKLVKEAAVDPAHPAYDRIQQVLKEDARDFPMPAPWKERVGRNDPCPCGSGKKYKYCCMRRD